MKTQKRKSVSGGSSSTRSKTSDKESETSALPLPIDLTIDIFSRLPSKSIAVCRCVSKPWASTLLRQDFADLFLTKSSTRPPQLLFAQQKDGSLFFSSSSSPPPPPPQPQNPEENSSPVVSADPLKHFDFDSSCEISQSCPWPCLPCAGNEGYGAGAV